MFSKAIAQPYQSVCDKLGITLVTTKSALIAVTSLVFQSMVIQVQVNVYVEEP